MKKNYVLSLFAALIAFSATAQDVTLWGGKNTPDGEFAGGLNNWTTKGVKSGDATKSALAVWKWDAGATATPGFSATKTLNSVSKANGAAVFNSDFLDNDGDGAKVGLGACPAPHTAELISPKINLTNEPNVTIVFSQLYRNFRSKTAIQYSKDDGVTWSENIPVDINELCTTFRYSTFYTGAANLVHRVQLPGAGGTDKFKFKFVFDGDYYFWIIDDVSVVRQEENNLRTNLNFFAIPENLITPASQVRPIPFLNDIQNLGSKDQPNAKHFVTVRQGATATTVTNVVLRDSLVYAVFPKDSTIENKLFSKQYTPAGKGFYAVQYSIKSNLVDADLTNNQTINVPFTVSDSTFAKETRRTRSVAPGFDPGEDHEWAYGNVFHVVKGKGYKSGVMEFSMENGAALKDLSMTMYLYEWVDANNDTTLVKDELEIVGLSDYVVKGTETNTALVKVKFENFLDSGKAIALKDNTTYVVMVESNTTGKPADVLLSGSDDYEYTATSLAYGEKNLASYSDILSVGDQFFNGGFSNVIPRVRWNVVSIPSGIEDIKLDELTVKVGPNPAVDYVNVNFNFEQTMKIVDIRMTDMTGKTVMTAQFENIQNDTYNMNVTNLAAGTYQMYVKTDKGVITKSFVVAR